MKNNEDTVKCQGCNKKLLWTSLWHLEWLNISRCFGCLNKIVESERNDKV